jgi:hypothetical protein
VDDLDAADGFVLFLADLVGGEESGVDEGPKDLGCRMTGG